jgi:four helix bundle protein
MSEADDLQARAEAFADVSIQFIDGLPKELIAQRMAGQLLDSSTSVASNYRAARRGRSHDEFTAKLGVVSEEADECVYWLTRFKNARITSSVPLEPLLAEAIELSKIFAASARTARSRRKRRRPGDPPAR